MTGKLCKGLALALSAAAILSFDVPKGWFKAGSDPDKYDMGIEFGSGRTSPKAATIQSVSRHIHGFGTLMQNISADKYRGKRVRLTGYMRSSDVRSWAGFWLRVDEGNGKKRKELEFDNMHDRAVSGTTGWKKYDIVLDVPQNATNIAFGALLSGTGKIWFDDLSIDEAPTGTATTSSSHTMQHTDPENLGFEE